MKEIAIQLSPGHTFVYKQPTHAEFTAAHGNLATEWSDPIPNVDRWRGHKLPLRIEFNLDEPHVFYELLDADHRRVNIEGDFEQLRGIMNFANASAVRYYPHRGMVLRGEKIAYFERLSDLHPCDRRPPRVSLAFECMIFRAYTNWITKFDLWDLESVGVLNPDMTPQTRYVERWHDWRLEENEKLRKRKML